MAVRRRLEAAVAVAVAVLLLVSTFSLAGAATESGVSGGLQQQKLWPDGPRNPKSPRRQAPAQPQDTDQDGGGNESLRISVVTWNMAETSPPEADMSFIHDLALESDLVCLGVQEVENIKPRRHEGRRSREWSRLTRRSLGKEYVRVGHHAMGAIQLSVFARKSMLRRVKLVKMGEVACGVGNVLQNKGAVAAFLRVDKTTFLFINAHLAAHQGKIAERNGDYWRIVGELEQELPLSWIKRAMMRSRKSKSRKKQEDASVPSRSVQITGSTHLASGGTGSEHRSFLGGIVDRVFFFGDLNYRVDLTREDLEAGLADSFNLCDGNDQLLPVRRVADFDQLSRERSRGTAFGGFTEARLEFLPTFKFDRGSDAYDSSSKKRVPAWTDRILYLPHEPAVRSANYHRLGSSRLHDATHAERTYS